MKSFKIKEAFHSIRNGANIKQDKISGGIPVTRIETISESTIDLDKLGYAGITDDSFKNFYLQEGDILMSHINSISHLGKVAIFENRNEIIIHGMNLLCLKARKKFVYPKYAYYFFRSPIFISSLKPITKKSVNQASFNISNFENIEIIIPEKYIDQIRIATVLSKVEILIKQRKASIDLLNEYLKSTFLKMFGNPVRNEKGWTVKKLNDIIKVGTGGTPSRLKESEYYNGNINWAKTTEVNGSYIYSTEEKITSLALEESNCKVYPIGTILLAMYGQGKTRGNVGFLKIAAATNQACAAISPSDNINQIFLYELLKHSYSYLRSLARGGNQENLNLSIVGNINIIMPDTPLQNIFESIVLKTEVLKNKYQESLFELESLFNSISQKVFNGELDLSRMDIFYEVEYSNTNIDRKESKSIDGNEITVERNEDENVKDKIYGDPSEIGDKTAKIQGGRLSKERKAVNKEISNDSTKKINWESTSALTIANFISNRYWNSRDSKSFNFSPGMLYDFLYSIFGDSIAYYTTKELIIKKGLNEDNTLKSFIDGALNNLDFPIKFKQEFYDAEKENFNLELLEEDFLLLKKQNKKFWSGIYFKII
jgi:type I restriction enzyme S subunit